VSKKTKKKRGKPVEKLIYFTLPESVVRVVDEQADEDDRSRSAYLKRLIAEGTARTKAGDLEVSAKFKLTKDKEDEIQVFTRIEQKLIDTLNVLSTKEQRPRSVFLKRLIIQGINLASG